MKDPFCCIDTSWRRAVVLQRDQIGAQSDAIRTDRRSTPSMHKRQRVRGRQLTEKALKWTRSAMGTYVVARGTIQTHGVRIVREIGRSRHVSRWWYWSRMRARRRRRWCWCWRATNSAAPSTVPGAGDLRIRVLLSRPPVCRKAVSLSTLPDALARVHARLIAPVAWAASVGWRRDAR